LSFFQIAVLALVQGITEFLPVSSHAHLIIVRRLLGLPEAGLSFDIAVHVGTLAAVVVYYRRDVWLMFTGLLRLIGGRAGPGARLVGLIAVATIPAVIAGYLVSRYVGERFNTIPVIAWTTVLFAIPLYLADKLCMTLRRVDHMTPLQALVIGCGQALALIPGVSRSGITMTAARIMGYERTEAVKFSLLMSIAAIAGAAVLDGVDLYKSGDLHMHSDLVIGAGLTFIAALAVIPMLVGWLRRATFAPFVIYRLILGAILFAGLYSGWISAGAAPG